MNNQVEIIIFWLDKNRQMLLTKFIYISTSEQQEKFTQMWRQQRIFFYKKLNFSIRIAFQPLTTPNWDEHSLLLSIQCSLYSLFSFSSGTISHSSIPVREFANHSSKLWSDIRSNEHIRSLFKLKRISKTVEELNFRSNF